MDTVEYTAGRFADLYGGSSATTALLWHGTQTDSRAAVRNLAERIAERGVSVIVPDWDSHAPDGGRSDLLASAAFARDRAADGRLVVIGWSLGGVAAAGLTLRAAELNIPVTHTVCLGGAFWADDPISGGPVQSGAPSGAVPTPFTLLTGDADDVVPASASIEFAAELRVIGWSAEVMELRADHGSIAGARYDAAADRYEAADDPQTHAVADAVAEMIVARTETA
ncbi:alpha/beta fold hydrolase [Mycobacterium sp. NPDC003323]